MICSICHGEVIWMGPEDNPTHTKCLNCGRKNCQVPDDEPETEIEEEPTAISITPEQLYHVMFGDDKDYQKLPSRLKQAYEIRTERLNKLLDQ